MLTCQFTGQMYDIETQFVKKEILLHVSSGARKAEYSAAPVATNKVISF